MFDNRTGEIDPGVVPPEMPYKNATNPAKLQGFVSTYCIDSFFTSMLSVFNATAWINATMVSSLNTTSIDILMPGIKDHYGAEVPMNIKATLQKVEDIDVFSKNQ